MTGEGLDPEIRRLMFEELEREGYRIDAAGLSVSGFEEKLAALRQSNARMAKQLAAAKEHKDELVQAVYRAAFDAILGLEIAPVAPPKADKRTKGAEVAIAMLSDWQLGKSTPTYNSDVCEQRIQLYADKVAKITNIQRADHPVKELRVYLLGDLCEGEQVFPGQAFRIDSSLYRQIMLNGPRILGTFLRQMLTEFEKVHVVTVIGNHGALAGRARKEMHPESNADSMLVEVTRQVLANEPRLTWAPVFTPGERHWYALDYIGKHGWLLFHGDQVRGFAGVPWYGFDRRLKGWALWLAQTSRVIPFQFAASGHYHTPFREYVNGITHWGNPSTESDNTYAAESLAASGEPGQWLLFCSPTRGVTCEYLVQLGENA